MEGHYHHKKEKKIMVIIDVSRLGIPWGIYENWNPYQIKVREH